MIETCGSYRRLKSSCGDIDMLMTFKDGRKHVHETALAPLIDKLKDLGKKGEQKFKKKLICLQIECNLGFLIHDLINHSETASSTGTITEQLTYFGVCRLPEPGSLVNMESFDNSQG